LLGTASAPAMSRCVWLHALQGGPLSTEEAKAFLALPHARQAITLRHAEDAAKVVGLAVPELDTYRPLVKSLWR
jgi:predicted HD phosphohydrolase